jgi:COP9 signalosome complex subunit 7
MAAELQQFCILAKTQKSRACSALVQQVLSHRKIFLFGELLSVPSVISLNNSEFSKSFKSLELFAYGTYYDYVADRESYLDLSDGQITKLKQLSIVSLAEKSNVVTYDELAKAVEIEDTRILEDLIIETIYLGLIDGKLDQKNRILKVFNFISRDIRHEQMKSVIEILKQMRKNNFAVTQALLRSSEGIKTSRQVGDDEQKEMLLEAEKVKNTMADSLDNGAELSSLYSDHHQTGNIRRPKSSSSRGSKLSSMSPMSIFNMGGGGRDT